MEGANPPVLMTQIFQCILIRQTFTTHLWFKDGSEDLYNLIRSHPTYFSFAGI